MGVIMAALGRMTERQLQLFFLIQTFIARFEPQGLAPLIDSDVAAAAGALAATYETRASGVLYEHRTESSSVAEALRKELAVFLEELGKGGGSRFEREAAGVLRGIERGARHQPDGIGTGDLAYLTLIARVLQLPPAGMATPPDGKPTIVIP